MRREEEEEKLVYKIISRRKMTFGWPFSCFSTRISRICWISSILNKNHRDQCKLSPTLMFTSCMFVSFSSLPKTSHHEYFGISVLRKKFLRLFSQVFDILRKYQSKNSFFHLFALTFHRGQQLPVINSKKNVSLII